MEGKPQTDGRAKKKLNVQAEVVLRECQELLSKCNYFILVNLFAKDRNYAGPSVLPLAFALRFTARIWSMAQISANI